MKRLVISLLITVSIILLFEFKWFSYFETISYFETTFKKSQVTNRGNNYFNSLINTNDGYIGIGYSYERLTKDALAIKFDNKGNIIWETTFNNGKFNAVVSDKDNFLLVGDSGLLLKLDSSGNSLWEKTLTFDYKVNFQSIKRLSDSSFIIVGDCYFNNYEQENVVNDYIIKKTILIKIDENGQIIWNKIVDVRDSKLEVYNGEISLLGSEVTIKLSQQYYEELLLKKLKFNSDGQVIDNISLNDYTKIISLVVDDNGDMVLIGYYNKSLYRMAKISQDGETLWFKDFDRYEFHKPKSLSKFNDDYFYALEPSSINEYSIIKYDFDGEKIKEYKELTYYNYVIKNGDKFFTISSNYKSSIPTTYYKPFNYYKLIPLGIIIILPVVIIKLKSKKTKALGGNNEN